MKRQKRLMDASAISDFRVGVDKVVRRGSRCFVVASDTATAQYAETEVRSDVLTDEFRANFAKLTPAQRILMAEHIRNTPYLSDEGRKERLALLGIS